MADTITSTDAAALRQLVADGRLETVMVATVDAQGRLKGKEFDADHYLTHLAAGSDPTEACAYLLATDLAMTPLDGFTLTSWDRGYGDMALRIDPGTFRLLPWLPNTGLVLTDPVDRDGMDLSIAPRAVLRHQLALLAGLGYQVRCGLEAEFVLYHGRAGDLASRSFARLRPLTWDNRDYALDQPGEVRAFTRALSSALRGAGLPLEAVKGEGAPGQIEVTFRYGEPQTACEQHLLMKHAARSLGDQHRITPAFMAAPQTGTGSGLHIHLSLWADDNPVMGGDGPAGLSSVGEQAVAGLIEVLPHLGPLYAPTVNSYRRYATYESFAPARWTWGPDNRSCAVRVVGHGSGTHLEIRVPGIDANPYLALAASVAAIRCGIEQQAKPPAPQLANSYLASEAPRLAAGLDQSLAAFTAGPASQLLGGDVADHYAHLARLEAQHHRACVTDVERVRGFAQS